MGFVALACNLYATGFDLFTLWQRNAQHAVAVLGYGAFGVDRLRQRERARERAVRALYAVVVVRIVLFLESALAAQRDDVVLYAQIKVFSFHARQLGFEHNLILVLVDVHAGVPSAARYAFVIEGAREVVREETVDFILQRPQITERVVTDDSHNSFLLHSNTSSSRDYRSSAGVPTRNLMGFGC